MATPTGYQRGYDDGYAVNYDACYAGADGYDDGYADGWNPGYALGYGYDCPWLGLAGDLRVTGTTQASEGRGSSSRRSRLACRCAESAEMSSSPCRSAVLASAADFVTSV